MRPVIEKIKKEISPLLNENVYQFLISRGILQRRQKFHESNLKYILGEALERIGANFWTEAKLPIYPTAPHLRGLHKNFVRIDVLLKVDNYFVGFECKESVSHLSQIDEDERIAYINNLSAVYLACFSDEKVPA